METRMPRQALALASALLAIAAGCAPAPAAPAAAPAAGPAPGAAEMEPRYGGKYIIGNHGDLVSFEAVTEGGALHLSVTALVQSGLMQWGKTTVVDPAKISCDLCESWKQIDPTTFEFKLRQGVRWHNVPPVNGRELVADDVKYTFERVQTGNFERKDPRFSRQGTKLLTVQSIETPDKYTARLRLKGPDAVFLWNMGDPFIMMVAKEQVDEELRKGGDGLLRSGLVGTGPFILKEFTPKVSYTMARNPEYFLKDEKGRQLPYLDGAEVRFIADNTTRFNAFRAGEIHDPGFFMDAEKKRIIDRQHPNLFMGEVGGLTQAGGWFNLTKAPFSDPRVRKAIHLATDRQAMIEATRFGRAQLTRWLASAMGIYATPEAEAAKLPGYRPQKEQDIAEATKLLAEAGFPNGFSYELFVIKSGSIEADAEVFAEQMRKNLNLDVKLVLAERAVHAKETLAGNFQMSLQYTLGSSGDPSESLGALFTNNGENFARYSNRTYDDLFNKQLTTVDPQERAKVIAQMLKILDDDNPVLMTYTDFNYKGYPKGCHGVLEEHRYNVLIRYVREAWCEAGALK